MEHSTNPNDADTEASSLAKSLHITLELDGDDPAFTNSIGLDVVTTLQDEGYSIEPVYTGQRGGDILVEIGMTLAQALIFVKDNHAAISEGIGDLGGLVGICTGVVPLCKQMLHATAKHTQTGLAPTGAMVPIPIKITVEIDGHPISVEAADLEQAKAAIILAHQFATAYPAAAKQVSPATSKVKAHGQITRPPRQKRGGRR
jgi:hypothetical protein